MTQETELQVRLRRAKDALAACRETEAELRRKLTEAIDSTKRAKDRYDELFIAEDQAERARRIDSYRHATH